jgi:hypothetical protein
MTSLPFRVRVAGREAILLSGMTMPHLLACNWIRTLTVARG